MVQPPLPEPAGHRWLCAGAQGAQGVAEVVDLYNESVAKGAGAEARAGSCGELSRCWTGRRLPGCRACPQQGPTHALTGYARSFRVPNQTPATPISGWSQSNHAAGWRAPAVASIINTSSRRGPATISGGISAFTTPSTITYADQNRGTPSTVRHPGADFPAEARAHEPHGVVTRALRPVCDRERDWHLLCPTSRCLPGASESEGSSHGGLCGPPLACKPPTYTGAL